MSNGYIYQQNPYASVGNSITNAYAQYLNSKPTQMELEDMRMRQQNGQRQGRLLDARIENERYDLNEKKRKNSIADTFSSSFASVPSITTEGPMPQGQFGPGKPVSTPDYRGLAGVMQQYAGQLPEDMVKSVRNSLGTINALTQFTNPVDIQMALDDNMSTYTDSSQGFREKQMFEQNEPFTLSPGAMRFNAQGQQIAAAPFKEGSDGMNITLPDGTTISQGGNVPAPGKTLSNDLQKQQVASAKMRGLIDYTRQLASEDPMNFGVPGFVKGKVQDVTALLKGIADTLGYRDIGEAQRAIAQSGVDPKLLSGVFDPNLPALHTASDLLVFQAASALAGQEGRSVSDRDVQMFRNIVGDPSSLFTNQEKFLAKLTTIENILGMNEQVVDTTMRGNVTGRASGQTGPQYGQVEDGYVFLGGDPSNPENWSPIQQ